MNESKQQLLDTLAGVARALGQGNRLELIERLAQTEASVDTLADRTGLSVANTSQHLQQLRRAGLVTARRQGRQVIYGLTDERVVQMVGLLGEIAETNLAEAERLVGQLFSEADADGALEPVARETLRAGVERGDVTLLDVRSEEEYQAGHLPGAINAPLDRLDQVLDLLPGDREIVAYCRGPYCALSHDVVQHLAELGFRARRFEEGFPQWKAAGLPVHA